MIPETRYARLGDLHLAYQVLGDGPMDILLLDQWFSHMEAQWEVPPLATLRERLAEFGRLIMFDKRGTGLSDPIPTSALPTIEELMKDIPAILDAVGSEKAALIANIGGGILAIPFAAAHPERVASLILVDCFARFQAAPDFPIGAPPEAVAPALDEAEDSSGRGITIDLFAPSVAQDERLRRAWSRYERQSASPGSTKAIVRLIYESDVRGVLPAIRVPTLVIHRAEATGFRVEHGRYLAQHIAGARYVELPGVDNLIWAGDQQAMVAEIQDFITGVRPAPQPHRVLATVLFTDIVDSTRLAAELGDERWKAVLADHHRLARRELDRFGGHEVKTVGDGILATFDGPAHAVRCAAAIRDGVREFGPRAAGRCSHWRDRGPAGRYRWSGRPHWGACFSACGRWRGACLEHREGSGGRFGIGLRGPRHARVEGRSGRMATLRRYALSRRPGRRRPAKRSTGSAYQPLR